MAAKNKGTNHVREGGRQATQLFLFLVVVEERCGRVAAAAAAPRDAGRALAGPRPTGGTGGARSTEFLVFLEWSRRGDPRGAYGRQDQRLLG